MTSVSKTTGKTYVCIQCDKPFSSKADFKRHLRIHAGKTSQACSESSRKSKGDWSNFKSDLCINKDHKAPGDLTKQQKFENRTQMESIASIPITGKTSKKRARKLSDESFCDCVESSPGNSFNNKVGELTDESVCNCNDSTQGNSPSEYFDCGMCGIPLTVRDYLENYRYLHDGGIPTTSKNFPGASKDDQSDLKRPIKDVTPQVPGLKNAIKVPKIRKRSESTATRRLESRSVEMDLTDTESDKMFLDDLKRKFSRIQDISRKRLLKTVISDVMKLK